ncbi:hypothetical protein KZO25_06810 [Halomonas sp. ANAO-440]|uniref:hypothetical protein n=1 Tax=Halomonas sp. ANAO-440 TaxID=2861360 RepID=UPI001CAA5C1C|nr:hypothetical protein [Halomonas sp. ANAO-440]MBZ0330029.1 hypothetical protein [Halomonas sp. ANAO-440]
MSNKMHSLKILSVDDVKEILEFVTVVMNDWEGNTGFQNDEPNMSLRCLFDIIAYSYDKTVVEMTPMDLQERAIYLNRLEVAQIIKHGAM